VFEDLQEAQDKRRASLLWGCEGRGCEPLPLPGQQELRLKEQFSGCSSAPVLMMSSPLLDFALTGTARLHRLVAEKQKLRNL